MWFGINFVFFLEHSQWNILTLTFSWNRNIKHLICPWTENTFPTLVFPVWEHYCQMPQIYSDPSINWIFAFNLFLSSDRLKPGPLRFLIYVYICIYKPTLQWPLLENPWFFSWVLVYIYFRSHVELKCLLRFGVSLASLAISVTPEVNRMGELTCVSPRGNPSAHSSPGAD